MPQATRTAALLTQHGKAEVLGPALAPAGITLTVVDHFDTDTLGSFTREFERRHTQANTALQKARLACELSGFPYGLGSEGAFAPDPFVGFGPWNTELIAWWDHEKQYGVVVGHATGKTNYAQTQAKTLDEAMGFAQSVGFPGHGVIIGRPGERVFEKNIVEVEALRAGITEALRLNPSVWLETDMRAHRNPSRMDVIRLAGLELAQRLQSHCSICAAIGFGPHRPILGALCEACGTATQQKKGEFWKCMACAFEVQRLAATATVDARHCPRCNP